MNAVENEYKNEMIVIKGLLARIQDKLVAKDQANSNSVKSINWCHVGDLNYVKAELQDIEEFLTGHI